MSKKVLVIAAAIVVVGVAVWAVRKEKANGGPRFRLEKVTRGEVVATVTATGSLSAVTTVKVGSQVSGIIASLHADFNSEVKKGQLLAELDPTPFQATVDQRRADVQKAKVDLLNAELTFARAKNLLDQQLNAQADFDAAKAARDGAAAMLEQSEASLKQAQTNLGYTKIVSPIDGVVVDRQYDIGQTVAASFSAPTLFTIAQDLTKMQVLINVDEADIGRVRVGQDASFTVDAFPDRKFDGAVSQIRLAPQIVQNVVTYPVVVDVSNPNLALKPGMTANVLIPVDKREGVLRVANAALRFRPDPADLVPGASGGKPGGKGAAAGGAAKEPEGASAAAAAPASQGEGRRREGGPGGMAGRPNGRPGAGSGHPGGAGRTQEVYVEVAGGKLRPVKVRTSITDGNYTAVQSDELKEGDSIVLGLATARAMSNPGGGRGPGRF